VKNQGNKRFDLWFTTNVPGLKFYSIYGHPSLMGQGNSAGFTVGHQMLISVEVDTNEFDQTGIEDGQFTIHARSDDVPS
jgi:hypothetical protein